MSVYSVEQASNGASGIGLVSMWGQAGDDLSVSGDVDGAASFSFGKNLDVWLRRSRMPNRAGVAAMGSSSRSGEDLEAMRRP
ncbi:MAG: hypothetical protein H6512_07940 [Acidimicrobiia bacterium]|nr:hypothetical protein [Acidimicrobiia bacterium]